MSDPQEMGCVVWLAVMLLCVGYVIEANGLMSPIQSASIWGLGCVLLAACVLVEVLRGDDDF